MNKIIQTSFVLLLCMQFSFAQQFNTKSLVLKVNKKGQIVSLKSNKNSADYTTTDSLGVLLQLVKQGKNIRPLTMTFNKDLITTVYEGGKTAQIKVIVNPLYISFRIINISDGIDAVKWGPFNTTIRDTIGNTIGVVRDNNFAIGIRCLNKKTSGGELVNEEGSILERGTTATAKSFGSSLQAFTVNRSKDRKIKIWGHWPDVPVKGITDGDLKGSSIALFGCSPGQVLNVIETITKQEGLPYAKWKNKWIKKSPESGRPYLITSFSEDNVDTLLSYAKRTGLAGIYHEDPFQTWGHFVLKKSLFPHGRAGFKACVDKAHALGLRLGFHTLTTFITTNDAYVTPKPDPGLAQAGSDMLASDVSEEATEINVKSDKYFKLKSELNSVCIGDEIIRFTEVTTEAPYRLTGCVRGSFNTRKAPHKAGEKISRLIDHPYNVFFPDWQLQKEVAVNIANFINDTGADQMDFDGHEGTFATGMGDLSFNTFAEEVFEKSDHPVVFGSSRDNHYFWHINNYLNWGEPWYGGFRESQSDLRISNQRFYEDNYLPNMLGWFLITAQTSADDVNWMLARAAGFNAGYALVMRTEALVNPQMDDIINRINLWTSAQRKGVFNTEQKRWLKNPINDAGLIIRDDKLYLQRFKKYEFEYEAKVLQPGQPTSLSWNFENSEVKQTPQFVLHAMGDDGKITNPAIDIDNSFHLVIPCTVLAGQTLTIGNLNVASLYDRKGKLIKKIKVDSKLPDLAVSKHTLSFDAATDSNSSIKIKIELKLLKIEEALKPGS